MFKSYIRANLGTRAFTLVHHASASHTCLQAADYCNWAVYKKRTDNEIRLYSTIRRFVRSEFDILRRGTEYFYSEGKARIKKVTPLAILSEEPRGLLLPGGNLFLVDFSLRVSSIAVNVLNSRRLASNTIEKCSVTECLW